VLPTVEFAMGVQALAEELEHVGALKGEDGVPQPQGKEPAEVGGLVKRHVGGPFGLIAGPVIFDR